MNENRTIHLIEVPIGGKSGLIWNRLHEEREDICEALLNDSASCLEERKQVLQARLRKVDDALDRLMSGSYGHCSRCGRAIDDTRLEIDLALALCLDCWSREAGVTISVGSGHDMSEISEVVLTSPVKSVYGKRY